MGLGGGMERSRRCMFVGRIRKALPLWIGGDCDMKKYNAYVDEGMMYMTLCVRE